MQLAKMGTMWEVGLEEMGQAILKEHLRTASIALIYAMTPNYRAKQIQESLLFVSSTGLEIVIHTFGLRVDPDALREEFYVWCDHQRRRQCRLSSATTPGVSLTVVSPAS